MVAELAELKSELASGTAKEMMLTANLASCTYESAATKTSAAGVTIRMIFAWSLYHWLQAFLSDGDFSGKETKSQADCCELGHLKIIDAMIARSF